MGRRRRAPGASRTAATTTSRTWPPSWGWSGALAGAADDPDAVRLAAWYHDIAYDPERTDNEEVSAGRARAGLRGLVPDERVDEVERLVLLTAGHDPAPDDANGAVLCDADLAVLAGPPDAYAAYASAVREEYGHLSDEEFTAGRIAVLEHLLALPALYRTPEAARQWADRAARQPDRGADPAQAPRGFRTRNPAASSRLSSSRAPTGSAPAATATS